MPHLRVITIVVLTAGLMRADEGTDFFESKIRPVITEHCLACHSADAAKAGKLKGGLKLDSREGMRKGGDTGPAVVPGDTTKGTLLASLRHDGDLRMPPKGKLPDAVAADFAKWISMGAPDPRDGSTGAKSPLASGALPWSFMSPKATGPESPGEIDRLIASKRAEKVVKPAGPAD
ncbi:MAG: c-type cytochrome domain-containing protein, partial [Planctomycetota bacterium]